MLAWILLAIIVVASVVPPGLRPGTPLPHAIEHAAIFFVTGVFFGFGYADRLSLLLCGAIVVCAGIEALQLLVPGRHARLIDFVVDATAMSAGLLISLFSEPPARQPPVT